MTLEETGPDHKTYVSVSHHGSGPVRLHLLLRNTSDSILFLATFDGAVQLIRTSDTSKDFSGPAPMDGEPLRLLPDQVLKVYPKFHVGAPQQPSMYAETLVVGLGTSPERIVWTRLPDEITFEVAPAGCRPVSNAALTGLLTGQ